MQKNQQTFKHLQKQWHALEKGARIIWFVVNGKHVKRYVPLILVRSMSPKFSDFYIYLSKNFPVRTELNPTYWLVLSYCINITTDKCLQHREMWCQLLVQQNNVFYPWVQFLWQSWHTFNSSAYFHTSVSSSPGTPWGQRDTQNSPSWKLAHLVQFPEPWK